MSVPLLFSFKFCKVFDGTLPLATIFLAYNLHEGQDHTLLVFFYSLAPGDRQALSEYLLNK